MPNENFKNKKDKYLTGTALIFPLTSGPVGPYLWWKRHLDASFQDVVSGDLYGAGQLQVLHYQIGGYLREHLLDLMGLLIRNQNNNI